MSSVKLVLCDACLILLLGLAFAFPEDITISSTAAPNDTVKGNCSCGGFPTSSPDAAAQPMLAQTPGLTVACAPEGNVTCNNLCVALATATKAKGPEILCNRLKDCDELKLSVFYKICEGPWVYADMTADEALCCENSKPKACASAKSANATSAADEARV